MKRILLLGLLVLSTTALASTVTNKQIDNINATGGSAIAVPSSGTTFATTTGTQTLTATTINAGAFTGGGSFSGTFTGTPTFSGALSLTGGPSISGSGSLTTGMNFVDPSDTTKKLAFSLSGFTTGKTLTLSGSQTNSETLAIPNVGSGDTLATLLATQTFGSGSTWNGQVITVSFGGTGQSSLTAHDVLVGNGTSGITQVSPSTSGFVLTSNGTGSDPSFQAAVTPAPSLNGGSGSAESVTAAGGITLTSITYFNYVWVVGNGGAVTITATPSITACTADGQKLTVVGTSNTNTVTLQDQANLASSGLSMNGNVVLSKDSVIEFHCDHTQGLWIEDNRRG